MKFALTLCILAVLVLCYYGFGLNRVTCAHCTKRLRRRHAVVFGESPSAFTHPGGCADAYAVVHENRAHYGDRQ